MTKPIAERLLLDLNCGMLQHHPDRGIGKIIEWLSKQPENSKTFTLAEVEAIAREARELEFTNPRALFKDWFDNKLKELSK